jgi:hypothetical protein
VHTTRMWNSPWIKALAELRQLATREGFPRPSQMSDAQTTRRPIKRRLRIAKNRYTG